MQINKIRDKKGGIVKDTKWKSENQ
jgi:hypothetical protein